VARFKWRRNLVYGQVLTSISLVTFPANLTILSRSTFTFAPFHDEQCHLQTPRSINPEEWNPENERARECVPPFLFNYKEAPFLDRYKHGGRSGVVLYLTGRLYCIKQLRCGYKIRMKVICPFPDMSCCRLRFLWTKYLLESCLWLIYEYNYFRLSQSCKITGGIAAWKCFHERDTFDGIQVSRTRR
jgi:hypothetical protein